MSTPSANSSRHITLALQGGGSHGAFTWGVLDRLLEQENLVVEAISGASAGAMNASVYAYGLMEGGRDSARKALHDFWRSVSQAGPHSFNPFFTAFESLPWGWVSAITPVSLWLEMSSMLWSPYDNPFYVNALSRIVDSAVDFERLKACEKPKIFVCATNVRSNERKVFGTENLSANVLLASACIPATFRTVEIDGEAYWDGGYMGNPVLAPLLRICPDLVIVEVNPLYRSQLPTNARAIVDRLREITFNASLVHEINTINTLNRLIEGGYISHPYYRLVRFHHITADWELAKIGFSSKAVTAWNFLLHLRDMGRRCAEDWLNDPQRFGKVGTASSYDVARELLRPLHYDRRGKGRVQGKPAQAE